MTAYPTLISLNLRTATGKRFLSLTLLLLLGLNALTASAARQQNPSLPKGVSFVTSAEGISEYRFDNGLRVLLFPDQSKQTITVNITYLVGSRHEDYGETGMAHLFEHMLFKGTPNHKDIPQELTAHGTRPNGSTWYDRTNYYETFQATEENLKWALDLESDRMVNSFIAKKDLDSEMTVVRNEFESGENDPLNILIERTLSTMYLWHNYGNTSIGAKADLENVPIERLQAFYKTYYQPDNAVLLVAGKFDEAKTLALIHDYFGKIPRPTRQLPKTYTLDPAQDGERTVNLERVGDVQAVCAAYHIPSSAHPDYAALDLLSNILADTPAGRLHKALAETKKANFVFSQMLVLKDPGFLLLGAEVPKDKALADARQTMLQTIESAISNPPTKEEVERARASLIKEIELTLNSSEEVGLFLSEWIGAGDWRLLFLHRDRLKKVTPEDVKRVAATYLKTSNRTVGQFLPTAKPDRAEMPETPDVAALVKDYKGSAAVVAGEAFDPSPANIESRTLRSTTPGGLKLALLPKKTRGATVNALLTLRYGDEKSLQGRTTAAQFVGQMLMRGTTKHTRQQIQDELDKIKARVAVFGGTVSAGAEIETTRDNLPAAMRLVTEMLREPAFPQSEFEQLKQETLSALEQERNEPQSVAFREFQRHTSPYPKGHLRYVSTLDEEIAEVKALTLDEVKKFYADFYGAQQGEVAVIGDFDDKQFAALTGELLGGWKSKATFARVPNLYKETAALNKALETPDKANAFFIAGMPLNLRDDDPDYPALVLGNYMLGGGFLNSRLAARIRGKDGLSYGVGSQLQADAQDKSGIFIAFAIYAPQNATRLEAAFKEEIERALKDGFTAQELEAAKSGWLQSRQVSRAQDNELVNRLASYLNVNRTLAWDAELEKKIQALTAEQVVAALRRHLDVSKMTIIKAGDFAKATAK